MQKITPFLWFDANGEEAVKFYTSIFKDAKTNEVNKYDEDDSGQAGQVMAGDFELFGQKFGFINGGPAFKFNEAISFMINCEDQEEVDYYWEKLTADGGEESQCGWLKDKFGVSWQVIPKALNELMSDPDPVKSKNVMQAMLKMKKIIVADLEKAHAEA